MKKVKLLFVAEELAVNGAMISLLRLLKNLPQQRYDISLFLFNHSGELKNSVPDGITVLSELLPYKIHRLPLKEAISLSIRKGRLDLAIYRILASIQRFFNLNYKLWSFLPKVIGEYDVAICYTDGFVAPMTLRKVNAKKYVCWIHFTYSDWQQPNYVYDALKQADYCVPVSIEAGRDLHAVLQCNVQKHVIHNIVDAEECISKAAEPCQLNKKEDIYRIISVGRVTRQKGMDLLPQIACLLKAKGLHFDWYVVGGGDISNEVIANCREKDVNDCLHFIGPRLNCMPWIKSADVFVNPSRYEAWGITLSEALCLGKAVVASNIPVFTEQIQSGFNGLLCPIDPNVIADTIYNVLTNSTLREQLERNAVKYPFTKEYIIDEFNQLIEKLTKE